MIDKETLLQEIDQQRQKVWPTNTGEMAVVDVPKRFEQGWLNALRWIKELISSTPKFNVGQSIVPKNHQESGLLITDIRDGSYYSCDLEICKITEDDQWELEGNDSTSNELEEEIDKMKKEYLVDEPHVIGDITGADIGYIACYFVNWQKEQMLKDTKEGVVADHGEFIKFHDGTWIDLDPTQGLIPAFPLTDGDVVKVTVTKIS